MFPQEIFAKTLNPLTQLNLYVFLPFLEQRIEFKQQAVMQISTCTTCCTKFDMQFYTHITTKFF